MNFLFNLEFVVANHFIACAYNVLSTAVVQVKLYNFRVAKVMFKVDNITNVRTPEAIDALPVVANTKKLCLVSKQQFYQLNLQVIYILELIYQNVLILV